MIAVDLFCGLGGWAEGFLAEGYDVIGFLNPAWHPARRSRSTPRETWTAEVHDHMALLEGIKQHGSGDIWFDRGIASLPSDSERRRTASAQIAKIPFPLAQHIAQVYRTEVAA